MTTHFLPGDSVRCLSCVQLQSLRFYVAHANAGNRNMSESPVTSDIFRYPPETRTAAAVALAADKEDRLLHLVRGYGCAVILANLITTFLCSSKSPTCAQLINRVLSTMLQGHICPMRIACFGSFH